MDVKKQRTLIAAAVACLLATVGSAAVSSTAHAEEQVPCYGINACKGSGDCGGKGHSCAGKNECKGTGYIKLDKSTCLKIQDGRLTPEKN